jgi:hypothetical protein
MIYTHNVWLLNRQLQSSSTLEILLRSHIALHIITGYNDAVYFFDFCSLYVTVSFWCCRSSFMRLCCHLGIEMSFCLTEVKARPFNHLNIITKKWSYIRIRYRNLQTKIPEDFFSICKLTLMCFWNRHIIRFQMFMILFFVVKLFLIIMRLYYVLCERNKNK